MTSITTFLEERNYIAGKNALDTLVEVKENYFLILCFIDFRIV